MAKKTRKSHPLKATLSRTFISAVVLPFSVLLILFSIMNVYRTQKINTNNYQNTLSVLNDSLEHEIENISGFMSNCETDTNIRTFFYYFYLNPNIVSADDILSYKNFLYKYASSVNSSLSLSSSYILGVGFVPLNREDLKLFYHEKGKTFTPDVNITSTDSQFYTFENAVRNQEYLTVDHVDYLSTPQNTISISKPLWNNNQNAPIGFIKVDVSLDICSDLLKAIHTEPSSAIIIKHKGSDFFISSNENFTASDGIYFEGSTLISPASGRAVITVPTNNADFECIYYTTRSNLYAGITRDIAILFAMYFVLLAIAFAAFSSFSTNLTTSLIPIANTMKNYKGGAKVPKIATHEYTISELESLAELTDNMIDDVEQHIEIEYKTRLEQKRAEFRALQSEINPHFLYNTLNNLMALNRIGETRLLEESIVALSTLFRYTCEHTKDGLTTVRRECDFLENYLSLQKLRYDNRLIYNISIDPDTENYKCPKLILQPLVENAIVHGLEPADYPVTINISSMHFVTRGIGDVILLSVTNNGVPFDEEAATSSKRVGLANIEARLHAFWPDSVFIKKGGPGKLTEFHLIIADAPKQEPADEI